MNKFLLKLINLLPDPLITSFVRAYVERKIKKHANLQVSGMENLDGNYNRPYIFVCNHLSNADGLVLNKVLEKEDVTFVAGKKLKGDSMTSLGFRIVKTISIQPDSPDKEAFKSIINAVKKGNNVLIFPEGTRSRTAKMIEGKKGVLLIARMTKVPIVPVGIWGSEQFMPIRTELGEESFQDAHVHVRIGEAFMLPEKKKDATKKSWDAACMNHIMMQIAALLPEQYRGIYSEENE